MNVGSTNLIRVGLYSLGYVAYTSTPSQEYVNPTVVNFDYDVDKEKEVKRLCNSKIAELKEIISRDETSLTASVFKLFNETVGVSCENFVSWKNSFDLTDCDHLPNEGMFEGVRSSDLSRSVMWGVNPNQLPYITLKYTCDLDSKVNVVNEGVLALFQRYRNDGSVWSMSKQAAPELYNSYGYKWLCSLDLQEEDIAFTQSLHELLSTGKKIISINDDDYRMTLK